MQKILNKYSQKFMFIFVSITYGLLRIGFGLLIFVDNEFFLAMAFACRVLQGASNSVVYTIECSVFSMQYDGNDIMQMNSYFKVTLGDGLVIGLLTGTLLYIIGGYCLPFIVLGVFFLCFVQCVIEYSPSRIEVSSDLKERLCANINSEQQKGR
ncbi:unnamed protein product [Moneuplotes crassus]|uniref:Uncharacterized protein n=1 Tax=Euplotes crassus TaxID=5936 RepID=A0AAD1UF33_EUPCR|nr:unnamed protein product [Moneuplotes crassus]